MTFLPAEILQPELPARASVIWMHGLGADGHDFVPLVPELRLPPELGVRFIFPHAPTRPVSINNGYVMPAWYDILTLDRGGAIDVAGIEQSAARISQLLQRERDSGIPAQRIVLAGFSQGGALALHLALRYPDTLAGVMALSTYMPTAGTLDLQRSAANARIPVFLAHGTEDPMIPLATAQLARDKLQNLDYAVEWHSYVMAHSVCVAEIRDIAAWLVRVLG